MDTYIFKDWSSSFNSVLFCFIDNWQVSIFAYNFLKRSHYLIGFSSSGGSFCLGPVVIFSYAIFLKFIDNVCLVLKKKYIIKKIL